MNYRMTHIYLDMDSSLWNFRVRTPSDILRNLDNDRVLLAFDRCMGEPGFEVQPRIGAEVKFSLRTRNAAVAEVRKNQAAAELARVWAAKRSAPVQLDFIANHPGTGILALINRGVRVLTANGDDLTDSSDPSRVMMRQIAGAFHQYEKARLVAKLRSAREKKRAAGLKVEGRRSNVEIDAR